MEYMRIEGFLGSAFSRIINKALENKVGFKPNIGLHNLTLKTGHEAKTDEETVEVNLTVTMRRDAFERLIEEVTK